MFCDLEKATHFFLVIHRETIPAFKWLSRKWESKSATLIISNAAKYP